MLPNNESYVDLDWSHTDQFGLPQARRQVSWGENDKKLFAEMQHWSVEILKSAGAEIFKVYEQPATNHELGGCRMGSDPRRSVVNADCRSHDVANLYVVDGSVFPSASEKNPTLTIMALAARAADHISRRLQTKEM